MKHSHIYDFRLDVDESERIDKLLSNYFPEYSRATIQKWISNHDVLINGKPCSQKDKISSSCDISISITSQPIVDLIPEDIHLDIVDETDDYIIVNKTSGMVTHIAPGNHSGTLQNALYFKYPELSEVPRTGIIHRLDKNTSGLLVICRNLYSHNILSKQLQNRKFIKLYHSLVTRIINKPITIEEPIARHAVNRKKMSVKSNGRYALSKIKPLSIFKNASHVEIELITGRTHQIRVHLSFIKNPVIGDIVYGFKNNIFKKYPKIFDKINKSFAQYLHAYSLTFSDPKTNKIKTYTAPYPKEYTILLEELEKDANS
jgi:23S rRNA pseudouridine1911/1915/1917 synthase